MSGTTTQTADSPRGATGWMREAIAGLTGALTVVPVVLTLGFLAFAPLGPVAPQVALAAAFATAGLGGLVHATFSRTSLPVSGPSSPTVLTMATLVARLAADPQLAPTSAAGVQGIVALCGLALLLAGALQVVFAWLGLAGLARVVPHPVLAGFMNSAAILVVLAQIPLLLDLPLGSRATMRSFASVHAVPLALGLGTAATIWWLARRFPRLPAALIGLAAGTAAHAALTAWVGAPTVGAVVGALPVSWPWPPPLLPLSTTGTAQLLQSHAGSLALTAVALATIGALESSLNTRAVDQLLSARHDPRHELITLGCANMLCGFLGGLPLAATRTRALATLQAGGRGRIAVLVGPAALGLLCVFGGPLLALLPLSVLAGVMLTVAWGLADRWTRVLVKRWWSGDRSRDVAASLGVVALVVGTTVWQGMAAGIGLGVLLSLAAFAWRMNRPLVRDRYVAVERPSRRIYPLSMQERLAGIRAGIVVFELDGALFFGSSERLLDEVDALEGACRWLVLDLRRVGAIDESGSIALQQAIARLKVRGVRLELAGYVESDPAAQALRSFGVDAPRWPDADRAVEAAEQHFLHDAEGGTTDARAMAAVPLAESSLLSGLDPAEIAAVVAKLQRCDLASGEILFAEGDPGDRLYLVGEGSVSALSVPDKHGRTQRYLSVSPGMMIGETAMIDRGGRTASVVADAPTVVYALTREALDEIGRDLPAAAIRLHRNLALHPSQRLRSAATAWRASSR